MPVYRRKENGRDFFQCGDQGAKYFIDDLGEDEARQKAINQCVAIGEKEIQVIERQRITKPFHRPDDKKKKTNKGLMIGFWLPQETATQISLPEGEPPESLHMTLTYHGNSEEIGEEKIEEILNTVESFASERGPIKGIFSGIGRFNASESSDNKDVVYISYDAPDLPNFRQDLVKELIKIGATPYLNHGFTPHITLTYIDQRMPTPIHRIENHEMQFDEIVVTVGDDNYSFPLKGENISHNKILPNTIHDEPLKIQNARGHLRLADPLNEFERCLYCQHFMSPTTCELLEGPVTQDSVCDYIDSTGFENQITTYEVSDEDFLSFGFGLMNKQSMEIMVTDVINSPEGWIVQLTDGSDHHFSMTKEDFIHHTSINHHWTQLEANELVMIGRQILEQMSEGVLRMKKQKQKKMITKAVQKFLDLPLAPRGRNWDSDGAEQRIRRMATTDGEINFDQYSRAFLWWDSENPENVTSYKLQYADVVNGQLQAIPRGLFAIAAVLQGARGGVDIPSGDMNKVRMIVGRYYDKMRTAFDDDSVVPPWEANKSVKKEYTSAFIHKNTEERLVYGIVLEPNTIDAQDDFVSEKEIEEAAHSYMLKSQTIGNSHKKEAEAKVVQSYIAPADFELGGQPVRKGSWVMVTKIFDDALWKDVQEGNFTGYSIGGYGHRTPQI